MESGSGNIACFSNNTPSSNITVPLSLTVLGIVVVIPSTVQLLLCGVVLKVFYQVPSLRTVSSLPVIHLVTSDFVRAFVGFLAVSVYGEQRSATPSTSETLLCKAFQFINNAQFAWSNWAVAIVAYSRADVIVNVLNLKFTKRTFWYFAITSWLVSIVTSLPPLVGWSSFGFRKDVDSHIYSCGIGVGRKGLLHALYMPLFYAVNYFIPSVLVVLCFSRVLKVTIRYIRVHNSPNNMQTNIVLLPVDDSSPSYLQLAQQQREQTARNQIRDILRSKAFRYIVAVVMTNLLLFAPFVGVKIYAYVCSELWSESKLCVRESLMSGLAVLHTLNYNINAFLYVFWIRTVQRSAVNLFCCRRRHTAGQT